MRIFDVISAVKFYRQENNLCETCGNPRPVEGSYSGGFRLDCPTCGAALTETDVTISINIPGEKKKKQIVILPEIYVAVTPPLFDEDEVEFDDEDEFDDDEDDDDEDDEEDDDDDEDDDDEFTEGELN